LTNQNDLVSGLQVRKFAHLSLRWGALVKIQQAAVELVRSGRAKTAAGAAEKTDEEGINQWQTDRSAWPIFDPRRRRVPFRRRGERTRRSVTNPNRVPGFERAFFFNY